MSLGWAIGRHGIMLGILQKIGCVSRHTHEGMRRTRLGNTALIAIQATIMPHLQEQGSVAECAASLHAQGATHATRFLNVVFKIRILNVGSPNRIGRTKLILCRFIQLLGIRLEESKTALAVPTHGKGMNTLHRRGLQHA